SSAAPTPSPRPATRRCDNFQAFSFVQGAAEMKLAIMLSFAAILSSAAEASEYQIIPIAPPANSQLQWIQGIVNAPALNQSHQVAITYLGDDGAYHPYLWQ